MIEGSAMEGIGVGELAMRLRDMAFQQFQQKEQKEKKGKWKYILGWRGEGLKEGEGEGHNLAQGGREREGGEGGEGLKEELVYRYRVLEYLKLS